MANVSQPDQTAAFIQVAAIPKNAKEELRATLEEFRGRRLFNLRVWYDAGGGEMRPGKQGLAVKVELLSDVRAALEAAENEARRQGLLAEAPV